MAGSPEPSRFDRASPIARTLRAFDWIFRKQPAKPRAAGDADEREQGTATDPADGRPR
jgi:hypothetical protein